MASSRVEVVTYFALRLLLLSSVLLPLILFELRQRAYLIFGIGWVVVCLLLANPLHRSLGIAPEQVGLQFNYYFLVDFISLFCIVLIVSSFFFLQRISREYEKRHTLLLIALQVSNEELTHNKQSLEVTTQELFATNQTLREQNEQIDAQKTLLQVCLEENYKVNEQLQQAKEEIQTLLEEQLRQSELKFQELTESITEMFFALDNKLQFLYWNKACERLTGKPAKAVLGTSVYEMFPTFRGRRTEATLQNVLASKQPVSYEYWDKITYTHFEVNIFPSNMGLVILLKDITDKKKKAWQVEQLNEQLLISNRELNQRNFELDQIVYKISHDIRSPLASVLGLVNLLQLEEMGEGVREYTIKIGGQILKLDRFTKLMLEFARTTRSALQCHQIDFEQLKNQCLAELEYLPHFARLHVTLHQEGLPLYTDALHMQIIFANLVANAIKYQYVERNLSYLHILITVHEKEAQMVFKDNGIGIDKEYLPRIFDMFFRASTQSNGSGLGMYIVKQTVEKLGGKVELESILGEGTIVTIKIPNRVSRNEKTIFSASAGVSKVESIQ
ncbi:ATP-binding protein [Rhodocytophaga aerolata]|uniref:histidine kinase n=1 Tax=Rhodocytophaga aerolata TaxID=455078 RepID=A0ABT8RGM7_9BACT|nr:ATP-binding protein [Rhodocytophaga aerolata]MDO1451267.1 ATP-binding protein [Rhodocytophaga aerolata]